MFARRLLKEDTFYGGFRGVVLNHVSAFCGSGDLIRCYCYCYWHCCSLHWHCDCAKPGLNPSTWRHRMHAQLVIAGSTAEPAVSRHSMRPQVPLYGPHVTGASVVDYVQRYSHTDISGTLMEG